jgi:hypothetical protein
MAEHYDCIIGSGGPAGPMEASGRWLCRRFGQRPSISTSFKAWKRFCLDWISGTEAKPLFAFTNKLAEISGTPRRSQ